MCRKNAKYKRGKVCTMGLHCLLQSRGATHHKGTTARPWPGKEPSADLFSPRRWLYGVIQQTFLEGKHPYDFPETKSQAMYWAVFTKPVRLYNTNCGWFWVNWSWVSALRHTNTSSNPLIYCSFLKAPTNKVNNSMATKLTTFLWPLPYS